MKRGWKILVAGAILAAAFRSAGAAETSEPLLEAFRKNLKKDYMSVGVLLQFVFDFQNERVLEGTNGFSVANARVRISGDFDRGFGYFLQTSFTSTPAVLDAAMHYRVRPSLMARIGQFKAPFSRELLTSAADIDFVNRARFVSALAPGRQIGLEVSGAAARDALKYHAGVFNGNGIAANGNDGSFLYAGRLAYFPNAWNGDGADRFFEFGVSAAFSEDRAARILGGLIPAYSGERILYGADIRMRRGPLLLAGEWAGAKLDPDARLESEPWGFHATAGWMVRPSAQILARWDRLDLDGAVPGGSVSNELVLGMNVWPTGATEVQINYVVNPDDADIDRNQVLLNAQIAF